MGFIDWHGNKQDHYEDVLEFAKIKEKTETDNFSSQSRKKAAAKFFGVPELASMETNEILILLLKEKKRLDQLYDVFVENAAAVGQLGIGADTAEQFYSDFWRCSVNALFQGAKIEEKRVQKFTEVILTKIFKMENQISFAEHYQRSGSSREYQQYLSRCFELKSGNVTLFWQWIRYLSDLSGKGAEREKFVKLYQRFMMHLSYYIDQLIPDTDAGKKYAERYKINADILLKSVSSQIDIAHLSENIRNPVFRLRAEEEARQRAEEENRIRMLQETAAAAAEREAEKFADLKAQKKAELEAEKRRLQESLDIAARKQQAKQEAEAYRLKLLEIEEQLQSVEKELKAKMMQELAALTAEQAARKLADLEAQRRAELEAERRRLQEKIEAENRRRKYRNLVKWARVIPGLYILDIEDEKDMVTAGRLYSAIRDNEIRLERMVSIFPAEMAGLVESRTIPTISPYDVKFRLMEQESLHYMEYATIYMQGSSEEQIVTRNGTLYITNQRIQLESGRNTYSIPYEYLKKAVIYDVMPEIIEFASSDENYFVRTANTELTYKLTRLIMTHYDHDDPQEEAETVNMEQLSISFLENADLPAFIFGIRTMVDVGMPENLLGDLEEMVRSLEYLDTALTKYPSFRDEADAFFTYYIPEAVKILYSYNEYEKAGLSDTELHTVYEKVVAAVQQLSVAAKQQVVEIYKRAIVDTTARANALADILGQDGFVDSIYKIKI